MTLWSLVDRPRSRPGREALRQRVLAVPETAGEIRALQDAHQAFALDGSG